MFHFLYCCQQDSQYLSPLQTFLNRFTRIGKLTSGKTGVDASTTRISSEYEGRRSSIPHETRAQTRERCFKIMNLLNYIPSETFLTEYFAFIVILIIIFFQFILIFISYLILFYYYQEAVLQGAPNSYCCCYSNCKLN